MEFRSLPPWGKLATWAVLIVAILGTLQAAAWLIGWDLNVLDNGTPLLVVALMSLLMLMSLDRRPISDYGLFVGPTWKKLWIRGIGTGLATYVAYLTLAVGLGVFQLNLQSLEPSRVVKSCMAGMTGFPLAITQQVLFSGYLLSMLRDRHNRVVAVGLSAALFAVMNRIEDPVSLLQPQVQQLMLGLFLVASLLGMLRLLTGSILVPTGLLAGWIFVRRFVGKSGVLVPVQESPLYELFAPGGDPRQAPLMCGLLTVGILASWALLRRYGEGKVPLSEEALNADFKRVFPFSHVNALAPLDVWLQRLAAARFRVGLDYVPRLFAITAFSTVNTILSLPERLLLPWLLRGRRVSAPVFIVGVHRSGTTHLHNLLALDPQFCTPCAAHIMNPAGCVFSGWLLAPLLAVFLPWRRPMDAVRFSMLSPQEEEFALAGSGRLSPYWGMTFPRQWPHYERYMFPHRLDASEYRAWQRCYMYFLQKLTFWTRKRPLLKNPYNTGRVAALRHLFPEARFIHICRHPYDVHRSNMHMAREGHVVYQLQDPEEACGYRSRFLDNYHAMESAFVEDSRALAGDQCVQLRFEDLEQDPINTIRQVYQDLGLAFDKTFEQRLNRYLEGLGDYRKNRHRPLDQEVQQEIDQKMGAFMDRWGYRTPETRDEHKAA